MELRELSELSEDYIAEMLTKLGLDLVKMLTTSGKFLKNYILKSAHQAEKNKI